MEKFLLVANQAQSKDGGPIFLQVHSVVSSKLKKKSYHKRQRDIQLYSIIFYHEFLSYKIHHLKNNLSNGHDINNDNNMISIKSLRLRRQWQRQRPVCFELVLSLILMTITIIIIMHSSTTSSSSPSLCLVSAFGLGDLLPTAPVTNPSATVAADSISTIITTETETVAAASAASLNDMTVLMYLAMKNNEDDTKERNAIEKLLAQNEGEDEDEKEEDDDVNKNITNSNSTKNTIHETGDDDNLQ